MTTQEAVSDMAEQIHLFGPTMNVTARLKAAMRESVRKSALSREQIADEMNRLARLDGLGGGRGSTISASNLDAWVAEGKANLIPVHLLTLFCHVTKDAAPLSVLAAPLKASVIDGRQAKLLAWAEVEVKAKELAGRRKRILSEIKELSDE